MRSGKTWYSNMRSVIKRMRMSSCLCEELKRSMPGLGNKCKGPELGKGFHFWEIKTRRSLCGILIWGVTWSDLCLYFLLWWGNLMEHSKNGSSWVVRKPFVLSKWEMIPFALWGGYWDGEVWDRLVVYFDDIEIFYGIFRYILLVPPIWSIGLGVGC